jgi:hypothetical protein
MKKITRIILVIAFLLVISVNWFFPYSFLSLNKSVSYKPDSEVVRDYVKDLNHFKKILKNDKQDNVTSIRSQDILQVYEQKWFMSEKAVKMKYEDIDSILLEIKNVRQILMDLAFKETYSEVTKKYLQATIEQSMLIEENIIELKNSKGYSRSTINRQYYNLHVRHIDNFRMFTSFYEEFKKEKR